MKLFKKKKKINCIVHGEHDFVIWHPELKRYTCAICVDLYYYGGWYKRNPEKAKDILSKEELESLNIFT
jgi:hypothetical protein